MNVTYNTSLAETDQDPVVEGYTFTGWYTDPECTTLYDFDNGQALTSDLTLYAGWQIQQRTVTFDYNGKGDNSQSSVDYGSMISAPADPSAQGYTFTGWYTDPACTQKYDFSRAVTDNLTLYAGWDAQKAVVSSTNADSNRTSPQTGVNTMLTGLYVVFGGALAVFGAAFASAMYIRRKFPR